MSEESKVAASPSSPLARFVALIKEKLTPLLYAGSSMATASAQLIAGFLVIKWITPEELGLWQSVRLAQVYSFILLLGINNGLGRELPFSLGKSDDAFAQRLAGTAFYCVGLASVLVVLLGIGSAIGFAHHGPKLVFAILTVTALISFGLYQQIFVCTFRSKDSFKTLTRIQLAEAGMSVATIPLVYFFHYNGMMIRIITVGGVVFLLMYLFRPMRVQVRLDWAALKVLFKTGLPIFGLDYMKNSCSTLDRVALLNIGGVKGVGIYALAGVAIQTLAALPTSLGAYLYPRMTYRFGQNGDPRGLWTFGVKFVSVALLFTAVAAVGAWVVLPWFVPAFLPKYVEGLPAAKIILLAALFEAATIIVNALWSMKLWRLMVTYQVACAALYALGPLLGVLLIGRTLEGVAWGSVMGAAGRGLLALVLTYIGTRAAPAVAPAPETAQA